MKRRAFTWTAAGLAATASPWLMGAGWAQKTAPKFVADKDFRTLPRLAPVEAPKGKIEVVEFFWYGCPHCNALEPTLQAWAQKLPKDVAFRRVPANFRPAFAVHQALFYALEAMGLLDKLHHKVFEAYHVQGVDLASQASVANWVARQGVDKAQFVAHYNSFAIAMKGKKATELQNAYGVEGVPSLGVAGRFYVDAPLAGSGPRMLEVVDFLVNEVRKGR